MGAGIDQSVATCVTGEENIAGQCTFEDVDAGEFVEGPPDTFTFQSFTYFVRETAAPAGYVVDPTVSTVTLDINEDLVVSHTYVNEPVIYALDITPDTDSNLVGTDHVFTATLTTSTDGGQNFVAAPGEDISFSLSGAGSISSISPAGPNAGECTTANDGTCTITITSNQPGSSTLSGTFQHVVGSDTINVTDSADKTWVLYDVQVEPEDATNITSQPDQEFTHTFTVTVRKATSTDGNGDPVWQPVVGENVDLAWSGPGTPQPTSCTTDGNGQCSITFSSDQPGTTTLTATYTAVEGNTSADVTDQGTKQWGSTNIVSQDDQQFDHTFTVTLQKATETDGNNDPIWVGLSGETVDLTWTGPGTPQPSTCTTDGNGQCSITFTSDTPGTTTLKASYTAVEGETTYDFTDEGTKTWVDYRVQVEPNGATNIVSQDDQQFDHTFTVTVEKSSELDGNGDPVWVPVVGETVDLTWSGPGTPQPATCTTDGNGQCSITFTSDTAGQTSLTATYSATEGETSYDFTDGGTKDWVDYRVSVDPAGATNIVSQDDQTFDHTFTVTLERATTSDGNGDPIWAPLAGETVDLAWSGPGSPQPTSCVTDGNGQCSITFTSDTPGDTVLTASYGATEGDTSYTFTDGGTKTWVDYDVNVDPDGTNLIGDDHVFTVTARRADSMSGGSPDWQPLAGAVIDLSLSGPGSIASTDPAGPDASSCTTDANGQCEVTITSGQTGQTTLTASYDAVEGATQYTFSDSALKRWVDVTLAKDACPTDVSPRGGRVDYKVTLDTDGPALADVHVVDDLPANVMFVSATDLAGATPVTPAPGDINGTVEWTIPSLAAGSYEATITVTVVDDPGVNPDGASFTNSVTMTTSDLDGSFSDDKTLVIATGTGDARAYGVRADLLGGGLILGDPDIEATPDTDVTNPDFLLSLDSPVPGASQPLVRALHVAEATHEDATSIQTVAIATAASANVDIPGVVQVQANDVVARSVSVARITGATSSSAGSRIGELVVNGEKHLDITQPTVIEVKDPLTDEVKAEVRVLEEIPTGAAAGVAGDPNDPFRSGLTVNAIHVIVHDIPLTPIDESSDVIVSHAESRASYPSGFGCEAVPTVSGHGYALDLRGFVEDDEQVGHRLAEVLLPITGGEDRSTLADVDTPLGTSDSADVRTAGSVVQDPASAQASTTATVEGLNLLDGLIRATAVEAQADADLDGVSASTTIADLVIADVNVCETLLLTAVCQPDPNTVLLLDGVSMIVMLNEQIPEPGGITVNAIHIWVLGSDNPLGLPAGAEIIISSAHADAHGA